MWFKELYEIWRSDNALTRALNDSQAMLEEASNMFSEAIRSLRRSDTNDLAFNIYEKDQMINKYQQEVRRNVLKIVVKLSGHRSKDFDNNLQRIGRTHSHQPSQSCNGSCCSLNRRSFGRVGYNHAGHRWSVTFCFTALHGSCFEISRDRQSADFF